MLYLCNGHQFEYMAASGALGFDGLGWLWEKPLKPLGLFDPSLFTVVAKTVTRFPRKGNLRWWRPWSCVRWLGDGFVNAVSLTNPGIEWWLRRVAPKLDRKKRPLVASIHSDYPRELGEMAKMLEGLDLAAVEINASCPNAGRLISNWGQVMGFCWAVRKNCSFPIILKLGPRGDLELIFREVEGMVEAVAVNSIPWDVAMPGVASPLAHLGGGGISGKVAQPYTWALVRRLREITTTQVIGPSVWEFEDIARLRALGCAAVSFGSVFLRHPCRPTAFVRRDMKFRCASATAG